MSYKSTIINQRSLIRCALPLLLYFLLAVLDHFNFNSVILTIQYIAGTIVFTAVPGYYLSLFLFDRNSINILERISLAVIFSFLFPGLLFFYAHQLFPDFFAINFKSAWLLNFAFTLLFFVFFLAKKALRRDVPKSAETKISRSEFVPVFLVVFLFAALAAFFVSRYPLIITHDAAYFHSIVKEAVETGHYPAFKPGILPLYPEKYPPVMQSALIIWHTLSKLELPFIFRYGYPILASLFIIPLYLIIKKISGDKKVAFLSLAVILTVPVIMGEIIKTRPQTMFFCLSAVFLYALVNYLETGDKKNYAAWLLVSFLIMLAGWKLHVLSILLVPIFILSIVIKNWTWIKKHPLADTIVIFWTMLTIYPYLNMTDVVNKIANIGKKIYDSYTGFAFLENPYRIITYFANYAFLLIFLTIIFLILLIQRKISLKNKIVAPLIAYSLIYIAILEIMPRMGFNFITARAFPHLAIGLIIFNSLSIKHFFSRPKSIYKIIFTVLFAASFLSTIYINNQPSSFQLSRGEAEAANFLKQRCNNKDCAIATQFDLMPSTRQICESRFLYFKKPEQNPLNKPDAVSVHDALTQLASSDNYINGTLSSAENKLALNKNNCLELLNQDDEKIKTIREIYNLKKNLKYSVKIDSVYIFLSKERLGLTAEKSEVWQRKNFIGIELSKFNDAKLFAKVYEDESAVIWQIKPSP